MSRKRLHHIVPALRQAQALADRFALVLVLVAGASAGAGAAAEVVLALMGRNLKSLRVLPSRVMVARAAGRPLAMVVVRHHIR